MAALNVSNMLSSLLEPADDAGKQKTGVDFSGKSLSMNTAEDVRDLVAAIQSCPEEELRSLNLSGNSLGVEAAGALGDALALRPELTHAHWADLFTGRMKTEIPQALCLLGAGMMSAKIQLTVLDLSDNAFGPIGVGGLADLLKSSVCTFLQELRLNNNGIGITGAKLLVEALQPMPVHLEVLEMGRNRLENVGAQALSTIIQNLPKLRVLRIPQNGVYLPGVTALCAALAQGCPRLTWLDLNDNTVGPRGAQVLADTLPSLPRLANLNLGDCLLKTRGAIAVLDAIGCLEELEDLNLSFDEIGPRALPSLLSALTGRSKTVRAELGGNSLGAAAKRELTAVPGVRLTTQDGDDSDMDDDDHESDEESESDGGSDSGASSCSDDVKEDPLAGAHDGSAYDDNDEAINLSSYSNNEDPTGAVARSPVGIFLCNPSADNLKVLGADADEIIKEHIQSQVDDMSHLDTAMALVMGLGGLGETTSAGNVLRALVNWAEQGSGRRWILANSILTHLELIKSEKKYSLRWDRTRCVEAFSLFVTQAWFPAELKDTLTFFVKLHVDDPKKAKQFDFTKYPQLYKNI